MSIKSDWGIGNSGALRDIDGTILKNYFSKLLRFSLTVVLLLQLILLPALSSSLSFSAPSKIDISGEGAYEMNFACSEDARGLSALLQIPDGFDYAGDAKIILDGMPSTCEPSQTGRSLEWDLSGVLLSCRHIVVNEWEQNPEGTDGGKEWIELYNPTSREIDISGWKLVDGYYGKTVYIPPGTVIGADGYQLLSWTNGSLINSNLDCILLLDAEGREVDLTSSAKDEKNNNLCWARYANGRDTDGDPDWRFQVATPGLSNGGISSDIYTGESLHLMFNLSAGCGAPSQASFFSEMLSSAGKTSAPAVTFEVGRANLSLSAWPDRFDIARGDEITWTVLLENDGNGAAYGVSVNATMHQGLQIAATDSPNSPNNVLNWSYASLAPGQREQVTFKAEVASTQGSYSSLFQAGWGPGPCQEIDLVCEQSPRTVIQKLPDQPRSLAVGGLAGFDIHADLPGGARELWINDTIPRGLIYNQSSLCVLGLPVLRELTAANSDGARQICWLFGDAGPAQQIEIAYNCLLENSPESQDGAFLAGTKAAMSWREGAVGKTDADEAGPLTPVEPDLLLEMRALRPFASPEGRISFTLAVSHSPQSHAPAFDLDLQALLPADLAYQPGSAEVLAGPKAAFDDDALRWHLDALDLDWDADKKALFRFNATCESAPGEQIEGRALLTWTSLPGENPEERTGTGGLNDYLRETSASVRVIELSLSKTADPDPVQVGETLTYTLTCENLGGDANNVTIHDDLDPGVTFLSVDPAPSGNNTWNISHLNPGSSRIITIKVRVKDTLPDGALLQNRFSVKCSELDLQENTIFTAVRNGTRLAVNKTALQKAVRRGGEASYIITICNQGGQPATNVTVRDVFDSSVELISAWPQTDEDGVWRLASLGPGQCMQMGLTVRVPRTDVHYQSRQNITGQGFVRAYRDYSTSRPSDILTNRVYVTSDQMQLSASANVKILAEEGTKLSMREHGSGDYQCREDLRFLSANKSIHLERSVKASSHPTVLALPGSGSQAVSGLWHEQVWARNGITNTTFIESYRYASRLDSRSFFELDENQSRMRLESDFQGMAHMGILKLPANSSGRDEEISSREEYAGDFRLRESARDLGRGLATDRSVSGSGYVSRDMLARGQRSYESGTGRYLSEEQMETLSGFMSKDLDASFGSLSWQIAPRTFLHISQKWEEGMLSSTPTSLIAEEYSSATLLKKKAVAKSPGERESEASFSGTARLRTAYGGKYGKNRSLEVDRDEILSGDYMVKRRIILAGASLYDRPHLSLRKDGRLVKDEAAYSIAITNDGNVSLGPLYLQDLFPPGARFLNSSLQPNQLDSNSSSWTLLHLSIGDTLRIEIDLNIEKCQGDIINQVFVAGNCSQGQVTASNQSVILRDFLGCCPPEEQPGAIASGIDCACISHETAREADYLGSEQLEMQWDGEATGSCLLNCPAIEARPSAQV
jgi:uncharacterized repeat protein (TIGR01451 family)